MVDLSKVEALLFDLGGVIVDISPEAAIEAFAQLGMTNLQEQITHGHHKGLFKQYELGAIDTKTFIAEVQELLPKRVEANKIAEAWLQMLVQMPEERIRLLERLKEQFPIYLLSNTNELHRQFYPGMCDDYENVEPLFNKAFYSYEMRLSKPDLKSFQYVIDQTDINPERTLFLDDSQLNLDAAKELGFQTMLISERNSIVKLFAGI